MNEQEANNLVEQLRVAHRLCVGYYQRLLPCLNQIAAELNLSFWYWEPCHNDRPCQSKTSPANKWAWDFVPLYAFSIVYRSVSGDTAQVGDTAVAFNVYLDYNYHPDQRKNLRVRGQPDPLTLPTGEAKVEVMLYKCEQENSDSFDKLFGYTPWVRDENAWQTTETGISGIKLNFPLTELLAQPGGIIQKVKEKFADRLNEHGYQL